MLHYYSVSLRIFPFFTFQSFRTGIRCCPRCGTFDKDSPCVSYPLGCFMAHQISVLLFVTLNSRRKRNQFFLPHCVFFFLVQWRKTLVTDLVVWGGKSGASIGAPSCPYALRPSRWIFAERKLCRTNTIGFGQLSKSSSYNRINRYFLLTDRSWSILKFPGF